MTYPTVDMTRYRLTGAGANGESYDCIDDPSMMLKLYNEEYPLEPVITELDIARKVFELGVPSPEPGELVQVGKRMGIRFRKIQGKRSYSRALADEPQRVAEFAKEYAKSAKQLHSTICPDGLFPSQKEQFLFLLDADKTFEPERKALMRRFIEEMPDARTAVHGDLHTGNLLTTLPVGAPLDAPHEVYFIDLGYFASGCPLVDIGMLHNVCLYADEDFRVKEMHVGYDVTSKFWEAFVQEYFFGEDMLAEKYFGVGTRPEDIDSLMKPYTCIKLLLVGFNIGTMPEVYVQLIRDTFSLS